MAIVTFVSQSLAAPVQSVSNPLHDPAFVKAVSNFPDAFVLHATSPDESFFAATFASQTRRADSYLATAFTFALVHLSARAGTAATTRTATAASATRTADGI